MNRSTLMAAAVFVLLLIGTVISLTQEPERGISRISLADVDTGAVDRIEVSGSNAVKLSKVSESAGESTKGKKSKEDSDALWRLESGKEADPYAVKTALSNINKIVSSDLVTRDKERFAELEVDEEKGARIAAYAGRRRVAEFVVGSSASGGGTHVRVGDEVYRVKGVYRGTFAKPTASWQQLKLFTHKLADVTRVDVQLADAPAYALVNKGSDFELDTPAGKPPVVPRDFRFDKSSARSLAASLVNLRAKEILDNDPGPEVTKLDDRADRLRLVLRSDKVSEPSATQTDDADKPASAESGGGKAAEGDVASEATGAPGNEQIVELLIGAESDPSEGTAYAKVAGRDEVVLLNKYSVQSLRKKATDLRDLKLVELDTAKVKKLSVQRGSMRLELEKQGAQWKIATSSEKVPDDFELDATAVTRRISQLSSARAAQLADQQTPGPAGLTRPAARVQATLEDGKVVTLAFGRETKRDDKDLVFARGTIDNKIYLASKWTYDNLVGGLDTYKKKADPGGFANLDPKALSNLPPDVRASLEKQIQQKKREQEMLKAIQGKMANKKKNSED